MKHLSADQVVRYLDGELAADEHSQIERHLEQCASCRTAMERTRHGAAEVGRLLSATDYPPPTMTRTPGGTGASPREHRLRSRQSIHALAALLAFLLIASAVSVTPIRAWVAGRLGDLAALFGGDAPSAAATSTLDPERNHASVIFTPTSSRFTLGIAHHQTEGGLIVRFDGDVNARAQVVDGSSEDLVVLPGGLRIVNGAASTASYLVIVPSRYASIELELGISPAVTLSPTASGTELRVDLAPEK